MSKGRGKIYKIFDVDIKRARERLGPDFLKFKHGIMNLIENGE